MPLYTMIYTTYYIPVHPTNFIGLGDGIMKKKFVTCVVLIATLTLLLTGMFSGYAERGKGALVIKPTNTPSDLKINEEPINILDSNESSNSKTVVTNYVESGIHISGMQKLILRFALKFIDDTDVNTLLQEVIKKKGSVNSNDIEQIISDNDLEIGTVSTGRIFTGSGKNNRYDDYCPGYASCPRRSLRSGFVLPAIYVVTQWMAEQFDFPAQSFAGISVGGQKITSHNTGYAIGYTGTLSNQRILNVNLNYYNRFCLNGDALLIIWSA